LSHDSGPVDGIDAGKADLVAKTMIVEHGFYVGLTVVEIALDGDGVDIGSSRGGHLALLDRRNASMREQDEHVSALGIGEGVNGSAARVAGCGACDGHTLVTAFQHMI